VIQNKTYTEHPFSNNRKLLFEYKSEIIQNYKIHSIFNILSQYTVAIKHRKRRSTVYKCRHADNVIQQSDMKVTAKHLL
jgi:hypothetical protein